MMVALFQRLGVAAVVIGAATGCINQQAALTRQIEATRLASELHVQFTKAAEASNRAVMADTDEASSAAAREAEQATTVVQQNAERLEPILKSLGYDDESRYLEAFKTRFAEYFALDREILPLAVENTNLKAQRLSFGRAREAADAFRNALDAAAKAVASKDACCVQSTIAKARLGVLEIQAIQARHIAESDDAAMTRMEAEMTASEAAARGALDVLTRMIATSAAPHVASAAAALDRFKSVNDEIVKLSRRNSNVRSLALSMGRKRTVTAECDDQLRALQGALAKHEFTATR